VSVAKEVLVFDMDGVLVEVTESYRETICQTVAHFSGKPISRELVQEYKNAGGWNNDWLLSEKIIADIAEPVPFEVVKARFNEIFFGNVVDGVADGLMSRERWMPEQGILEALGRRYQLAIFTGREEEEARMSLRRFAPGIAFQPLLAADHGVAAKPAPDGLIKIANQYPKAELWYVGDTVDDARSARGAGVPFIGIAAPGVPNRGVLLDLFEQEHAVHVLDDINQLREVLLG
jgi:HAD superfamily phosphatase